jgi:hypothetical protein
VRKDESGIPQAFEESPRRARQERLSKINPLS